MHDVRAAARDSLAVGVAAAAMGVAFGVLVGQSGLAWWWATVFASVIFAGSLEFVLLGLVTALAPLGQIAAAALVVNSRHVFYALSFPLHRVRGPLAKAYSTFALTDEAYALTATPAARGWSRRRILAVQAFVQLYWVGSVTLGALGGVLVPAGVVGLDFAVTALFVVLGIDAFRARRDVPNALVAVGCAVLGVVLADARSMLAGMGLFTAYLLVRHAVAGGRRA
ncbi:AzlC family ABC transporter permease [Pseudonocardia lacus]|uniref:AzlC family ABC transporter permease n=1 Tax=Pseudonocardia lacus TaxID=2835865 RepID=UPI0027E228E4|nr:AzlC family ABC transporter permease [Pseudonocardia lacus]